MRPPVSPSEAEQTAEQTAEHAALTATPVPADSKFPHIRGYEISAVIGTGGMGIVYEARHLELNRRVAIKTLRGAALADLEFRPRFHAEAEAIAKLQHPNIIQVFEVGTVEPGASELHPAPYIALEFVDGGSLAQRARAPQPPREAAGMVEKLARAAHAAHVLGIIHRDLKPANVLLTRDGQPKIADFGIAKQLEPARDGVDRAVTCDGVVLGTPEYMAPEQLRTWDVTPSIDIYSLGVILYELLTARVPFQGATAADTMILALHKEPVPPSRFQPGIPRDLETICLKCLEKTAGKRYESAEALADDLALWGAGKPIRARSIGPVERTLRWSKRNPAVAALSVAVLVVSLTGFGGVVWGWSRASANATDAEREARNSREAAKNERWERYRAGVMAASSALRLHDSNAARSALDDAPEEHRDWVWNLLHAQLDRSQYVLKGRGNATADTFFTPDGRWALLLGRDNTFRAWDTVTRREYGPHPTDSEPRALAISDDGTTVAYSTDQRAVVVRSTTTGETRVVLHGLTTTVDFLSFSANGERLFASSADRAVHVWAVKTGNVLSVFRAPARAARPLSVSPDGKSVTTRWDGAVDPRIWNLETGRELILTTNPGERIKWCQFNPKGDRVVTVDMYPSNAIRLWDVASGKLLTTLSGHENEVYHIQFSPDGTRLVSASMDRTVRLWDTAPDQPGRTSEPLRTMKGHVGGVNHVMFSPDGRRIVSAATDRTLRYWDVKTGDQIAVLNGHTDDVRWATFRADGAFIASAGVDGTVRLWDVREVERGYAITGHANFVYSVAFHPDGLRVASAGWDGTARLWDATTGKQLLLLDHKEVGVVSSVALHPKGRLLATLGRKDGVLSASVVGGARLWDIDTGKELHVWPLPKLDWRDSRLTFSPSGDLLAAGAMDGRVWLWDVNTRREVAALKGHTQAVRDVAFSPDGSLLASAGECGDATVRIWNMATKEATQILRGHTDCVYTVAWNPKRPLLASGSIDGTVRVWNTETWREVALLPQSTRVYSVAFSPDGTLLTVACADNLIRVWSVDKNQEIAELSGHANYVHYLAFSPDGTRLVSASGDRTLRTWDTQPAAQRTRP